MKVRNGGLFVRIRQNKRHSTRSAKLLNLEMQRQPELNGMISFAWIRLWRRRRWQRMCGAFEYHVCFWDIFIAFCNHKTNYAHIKGLNVHWIFIKRSLFPFFLSQFRLFFYEKLDFGSMRLCYAQTHNQSIRHCVYSVHIGRRTPKALSRFCVGRASVCTWNRLNCVHNEIRACVETSN